MVPRHIKLTIPGSQDTDKGINLLCNEEAKQARVIDYMSKVLKKEELKTNFWSDRLKDDEGRGRKVKTNWSNWTGADIGRV